jgi:starvation-inducible DNA-binding protein
MISDQKMIETLLNDHKIILAQMSSVIDSAENAGDEGTIDLVGAYIRELEKTSWMLNAWTKKSTDQLKEEAVAN